MSVVETGCDAEAMSVDLLEAGTQQMCTAKSQMLQVQSTAWLV